jgi:hypothetical protein
MEALKKSMAQHGHEESRVATRAESAPQKKPPQRAAAAAHKRKKAS